MTVDHHLSKTRSISFCGGESLEFAGSFFILLYFILSIQRGILGMEQSMIVFNEVKCPQRSVTKCGIYEDKLT